MEPAPGALPSVWGCARPYEPSVWLRLDHDLDLGIFDGGDVRIVIARTVATAVEELVALDHREQLRCGGLFALT